MTIDWRALLAAIAFMFVLEGIAPFVNPAGTQRALARLAAMSERELRLGGLLSMLAGVGLLFWVRS